MIEFQLLGWSIPQWEAAKEWSLENLWVIPATPPADIDIVVVGLTFTQAVELQAFWNEQGFDAPRRNYRKRPVIEASTEELIFELIKRNDLQPAPVKTERHGVHYGVDMAIGPDHTCSLTVDRDGFVALNDRIAETNEL